MSNDVQRFIEDTESAEDLGALPWWTPTQKTPAIVGRVLEYRAIDTEYGRLHGTAVELIAQAVVQDGRKDNPRLAEQGERVMIWHKNRVLQNSWVAPSSGGGPPAVGEVVGVKRTGERQGRRGKYPTVVRRPTFYAANTAGDEFRESRHAYVTVRTDTGKELGSVGRSYTVLENE
ncbi:MAG: hypothetical protein ACREM1_24005, partial [Longimicrobiales bacterium]